MVRLITIIASLCYYLLGFDYQDFSKSNIPDFLLWLQLWKWLLENTGTGRKCQGGSALRDCCSPCGVKFTHKLQSYFWNNYPLFRLWNQSPASPSCVCPKPSTPPSTEELQPYFMPHIYYLTNELHKPTCWQSCECSQLIMLHVSKELEFFQTFTAKQTRIYVLLNHKPFNSSVRIYI